MKRVRRQLSLQARRQFFLSVINPDFEYCASVFITSLPASERQRLLATYRRAVRATAGAHLHDDCDVLARQLRILPLVQCWLIRMCMFTFECPNQPASPALGSMLRALKSPYPTRGQSVGDLVVPRFCKKAGTLSFSYRMPLIWNWLLTEVKQCVLVRDFIHIKIVLLLERHEFLLRRKSLVFDSISSI